MIPHPSPEDLARNPEEDYYSGYMLRAGLWIRRAVAAEADLKELVALTKSLADRIEAQSQLLSKRAEKSAFTHQHHWATYGTSLCHCYGCGAYRARPT